MSQSTIPVFGHNYAQARVPVMWNKMSAIQDLLNAVSSEGDDPVDSYRWLDCYDQLHELMAAADLAITKLWTLHPQHKPWMMVPRIFMVLCSEWVPSLEGYGDRPKWAQKQTERAAASSGKGKQKVTQDDDNDDGADDHDDDSQGSSDDGNDQATEGLEGQCKEGSKEGRGVSCEGEPQQACVQCRWLKCKCSCVAGKVGQKYPDCTLMPANFSPLAGVNELQELFKGGFSATVTRLLQDEEMLVIPKEIPVVKEESPIKIIEQLEEIVEMNEIKVMEMHEDLARVTAWVSRFGSAVLEQCHQLREVQELQKELLT
ncbi:hypothetical protein EDC04DRAFT_2617535 [Pisolithus marmoratus]|nr:hypothetical protein EDC04DRAFT_2617535 [Pisolithus marmoratus]